MLAVEHLRIDEGPDLAQIVDRRPHDAVRARRRHWVEVCPNGPAGGRGHSSGAHTSCRLHRFRLRLRGLRFRRDTPVFDDTKHGVEPRHGIGAVDHRAAVGRSDSLTGEARRKRGAADQDRRSHAGGPQIVGGDDHLMRRLDEQSRQPDSIRPVLAHGFDQGLGDDLDPEVLDLEAVVGENDLDQVLADVVNVALDGGEDDPAAGCRGVGVHELLEVGDRGFHRLGTLQNFGNDQLVRVEQPPNLRHPGHQRPVDDLQRLGALPSLELEIFDQAAAAAIDDVAGEALIERLLWADNGLALGAAKVVAYAGHVMDVDRGPLLRRLLAPVLRRIGESRIPGVVNREVEEQGLHHPPLFLGDRRVTFNALGVDDREVEAGLGAKVEKDRVHDLAGTKGQPEADVGDAEHGRTRGEGPLDQPQPFDGLDRAADVVLVATRRRKDQRVEDDVRLRQSVLFGQQMMSAAGNLELALTRKCLRLDRVLVDDPEDDRRTVAAQQWRHRRDPLLAVLEVDRVDDRLALAVGERDLDGLRIGGVDHDRRLDRAADPVIELVHRGLLVALGGLQADIDDLRAALHLAAGDLGRFVPLAGVHELPKLLRANDVGALADQQRPVVLVGLDQVDARVDGLPLPSLCQRPRFPPLHHAGYRRDVGVGGAAAAADEVQPSGVDEARERGGQAFRRLRVASVLVRQTGVWKARHRDPRPLMDGPQVVGHEIGAGGAVEPDRQLLGMLDRGQKGVRRLAAEHSSRGLDGSRHHHRPPHPGVGKRLLDRNQRRLGVAGVLAGFDKEQVHPALEEAADLLAEGPHELCKGDAAGDRDCLCGRADRAGCEARPGRGGGIGRRFGRELRGQPVERPRFVREPVLGKYQRCAAKGVGLDDVGAG